jgi:hypothetical protein
MIPITELPENENDLGSQTRQITYAELDAIKEQLRKDWYRIGHEAGYRLGRHEAKYGAIEKFDNAACVICFDQDQEINSDTCADCKPNLSDLNDKPYLKISQAQKPETVGGCRI